MKRAWCKEQETAQMPTNIQLLQTYQHMVEQGQIAQDEEIENLLRKRSVRSMSGIVPIQVLTKPFWCPGECIFCPTDATMPKSYINTQPGAMRALLNQFDPYKQTYNRLLSLRMTGHATDKIEMIVLGGTWDVYPQSYKVKFIKGLYDACNTFEQFLDKINVDYNNPKAARWTQDDLDISYPETIAESIEINESAKQRIIGLTLETRPEYVDDKNCQFWRDLGVTRIEMGIQTLHNDVHLANKRGHDNQAIRDAMHKLRQYGFKVSNHYMPGLYASTLDKDIETFRLAYSSPRIKSDEQKFYPTAVIPNTDLYQLYKAGEYQPLTDQDLETIVRRVKTEIIPPYTRIKRLARDFDTNEVVAGANTPNLRQIVMKELMQEFHDSPALRKQQYSRLCVTGLMSR
ncbi:MAG: radical SAM protein [Candidatus Peribacteria bacterium]|nr:MAG: radical SAM protein [Candidatus Peribacteria bacterium]